jgi:nucleotide-binding universal stress UspA family protein
MSASNDTAPRIIVGVDGSPPSVAALRWAVHHAELTGGSIDAIIAWEFSLVASGFGWAPNQAFDDTSYCELATKTLNAAVGDVNPPPAIVVNQMVLEGNPAKVLLNTAKDADLLVVGNRGHGAFVDALIGAVSVRCLHHATCPVVVVRAPKQQ